MVTLVVAVGDGVGEALTVATGVAEVVVVGEADGPGLHDAGAGN